MAQKELIRQEIERLKKICKDNITTSKSGSFPYVMEMTGYDKILAFIDSLPEEKATCKTCGFYENNCPFIRGKLIPYPNKVCKDYTYSAMKEQEKPSEDFPTSDEEMAKFLATHPKVEVPEKYKTPNWLFDKQPSEDLEEAAEISFDEARALTEDYRDFLAKGLTENRPRPIGPHWFCEYAKNRFIAGAEWQRVEMMKDAVEAEITVGRLPDDWSLAYNPDELHRALLKFKSGDKVKIIIVKQ